jgi:son of sevenless-like protein
MKFSEVITREDMTMAAKSQLVKIVNKNTLGEQQKTLIFSQPPPKSYIPVPKDKDKLSLLDIHPEEFARQITLLEHDLYKAIKPWEFLTHTQGKKCANIMNLINRFNDVNKWVQTEILKGGETPKQRAVVFGKLLEICEHLKSLNNYNALMEIVSGLNASPIFRLKLTWAAIGSKQVEAFRELEALVSSNSAYKNLRTKLHTIKPPCIPYMGMYLTDLTFINDGNPQYLEQGYINFDKCRRLSAVIQEIIQYQQTPYCLKSVDEIQVYLRNLDFERDENRIYQLSLQLEERGSVRI